MPRCVRVASLAVHSLSANFSRGDADDRSHRRSATDPPSLKIGRTTFGAAMNVKGDQRRPTPMATDACSTDTFPSSEEHT